MNIKPIAALLAALALATLALATPAKADIAYADILADPDNPVLNQQFARQRLVAGDAKAALAAVERVLVAQPTNLEARLFRAEVLAALGADLQAIGELRALKALPFSDATRTRIGRLLSRTKKRQKRVKSHLNLAFGFLENDNASGWPSDNTVIFNGQPLPDDNPYTQDRIGTTQPITEATKDDALTQRLSLTSSYDLRSEYWRDVYLTGSFSANRGGDTGYLDGETTGIGLGVTYKSGALSVLPRATLTQTDNDFEDRIGSYDVVSGGVSIIWKTGTRQRLIGAFGHSRLLYEGDKKTNNTGTASGSLGYELRFAHGLTLNSEVFAQDVDSAQNNDLDKKRAGIGVRVRVPLGRSHFVTLGGSYAHSAHDNFYSQSFNPITQAPSAGKKRKDDITGLNIGYLMFGDAVSRLLDKVFFTLAYQNSETDSNIIGFSQNRTIVSAKVHYGYRF